MIHFHVYDKTDIVKFDVFNNSTTLSFLFMNKYNLPIW